MMRSFWKKYGSPHNFYITLVMLAFLILGTTYSIITPLFEATDELSHYPVVKNIADGHGLPVQDPSVETLWQQEGGQPPLYYALSALITSWIDTNDLPERLWRNPHATIGVPLETDNKNMIMHTEAERFPYERTILAVHIIRLLSVLMGAGTVLLTYLIGREAFPNHPSIAIGAAILTAFNPMFLFISGAVNNDNLVILLASLSLWLMIRLLKGKNPHHHILLLATVVALASLTKVSALGLIPLGFLLLAILAPRQRHPLAFLIRWGSLSLLIIILIAGWWYFRNWLLYKDPLGWNVWLAIIPGREKPPTPRELLAEFEGFRISYWALFGGVNVLVNPIIYHIYDSLSLLALVGLLTSAWRHLRRKERQDGTPVLILTLWIAIGLIGLIRWTSLIAASQGRLIFPAISAISLLFYAGLNALAPKNYQSKLPIALGTLMLTIATICPFRYIAPAYARPPLLPPEKLSHIPNRLEITYNHKMKLIGYDLDMKRVRPGESFFLTLYWRSLTEMQENYSIFIHLYGRDGEKIAQRDSYPGGGSYPTSLWQAGHSIKDRYKVTISPQAETPALSRLHVGLYTLHDFQNLPASDGQGKPIGSSPLIARLEIPPAQRPQYAIENPLHYEFAEKIALLGYDIDQREVKAGETLELILYWQALSEMERDYTVFTHLIDEGNRIWAQQDNQPLKGEFPTSFWGKGEILKDRYELAVREEALAGQYVLEVGIYDAETGARLAVTDEAGNPLPGARILLEEIKVTTS